MAKKNANANAKPNGTDTPVVSSKGNEKVEVTVSSELVDAALKASNAVKVLTKNLDFMMTIKTLTPYAQTAASEKGSMSGNSLAWAIRGHMKTLPKYIADRLQAVSEVISTNIPCAPYRVKFDPELDKDGVTKGEERPLVIWGPAMRMGSFKNSVKEAIAETLAAQVYDWKDVGEAAILQEIGARGGSQLARYDKILVEKGRIGDANRALSRDALSVFGMVMNNSFSGKSMMSIDDMATVVDPQMLTEYPTLGFRTIPVVRGKPSGKVIPGHNISVFEAIQEKYAEAFEKSKGVLYRNVMEPSPLGYGVIEAGLEFKTNIRFSAGMPEILARLALQKINHSIDKFNENGYGAHNTNGCGRVQMELTAKTDYDLDEGDFLQDADLTSMREIGNLFMAILRQTKPVWKETTSSGTTEPTDTTPEA